MKAPEEQRRVSKCERVLHHSQPYNRVLMPLYAGSTIFRNETTACRTNWDSTTKLGIEKLEEEENIHMVDGRLPIAAYVHNWVANAVRERNYDGVPICA